MKQYDVLCFGMTCCDLIFSGLSHIPAPEEEVASDRFVINAGGAANTALALHRLGLTTMYVSQIGRDDAGKLVYERMKDLELPLEGVFISEAAQTTVSAVLSLGDERAFATCFSKGGQTEMLQKLRNFAPCARHIHCFLWDALTLPIAEIAQENGCTLSVDTAYCEDITRQEFERVARSCDIFMINQDEAVRFTGANSSKQAVNILAGLCSHLVVKLGREGSMSRIGQKAFFAPALSELTVMDSTGTGDNHSAGYLYAWMRGYASLDALRFANASGALALSYYGGMDQTYTYSAVHQLYRRYV